MAELGTVNSLVAELNAHGRAKANNVAKLLGILTTCKHEAAVKAAIQGLRVFFAAAGQDGELAAAAGRAAKRQKVSDGTAAPAGDAPDAAAGGAAADPAALYREWLQRQYGSYVNHLMVVVTGSGQGSSNGQGQQQAVGTAVRSAGVQVCAAAALMECVRSEQGPGVFAGALFGRLLGGVLVEPGVAPEVFALLFTKYLQLADVRFYALVTVRALAAKYGSGAAVQQDANEEDDEAADASAAAVSSSASSGGGAAAAISASDLARNAYDVLSRLPETLPPDLAEWKTWCGAAEFQVVAAGNDKNESSRLRRKRKQQEQEQQKQGSSGSQAAQQPQQRAQWANTHTQKRLFGEAWLALLRLPLPPDVLRKALVRLPTHVIPHMNSPQHLADLLTHAINRGGLTGMLALNGLFVLVTRHGLEYPQFYPRLYQLLVPEAFVARSRAQFFRLADIFLSSTLVPAYTVAAFVKRFARLALGTSPAGAMIAIAFVHNLVRRHPALAVMLHNPAAASTAGSGTDPYDASEADPAKSRAVESSLWELEALRNHYCPQVSTFCAVLDKDLTDRTKTAEVNLEDLLGAAAPGGKEGQAAGAGAGSYNALIRGELARKLRKVPTAFYPQGQAPSTLFGAADEADWAGWQLVC